jgi:hypothetical protein
MSTRFLIALCSLAVVMSLMAWRAPPTDPQICAVVMQRGTIHVDYAAECPNVHPGRLGTPDAPVEHHVVPIPQNCVMLAVFRFPGDSVPKVQCQYGAPSKVSR